MTGRLATLALAAGLLGAGAPALPVRAEQPAPPGTFRIAAFNANLVRQGAGVLVDDIVDRDPQVLAVAEIILRVRPDILFLNEIDHNPERIALDRFAALLAEGVGGLPGLAYPHRFAAPPNTGVPSGHDLDGDGRVMGPGDALGYGRFPGQYGMAVLSRFEIGPTRTFRTLRWADQPGAERPRNPDGSPFWADEVWRALPLSTTSHWDVTVTLPGGTALHLLGCEPTPPVFDGPEDRNGLRNAAEIRFWTQYLDGATVTDDAGRRAALPADAAVVVIGDLNLDPADGDGRRGAIRAILAHPRLQDAEPASRGAALAAAAQGGPNDTQTGDPALDTADWNAEIGNMRVDYVLPSATLAVAGAGVFWPPPGDPLAHLVATDGRHHASSEHRLVWLDIRLPGSAAPAE